MHDLWVVGVQLLYTFATLFGVACAFRRRQWDAADAICAALASMGVAAFLAMSIAWFALPMVGMQTVVGSAAVGLSAWLVIQALARGQWADEVAIPALLGLVFTGILLAWAYGASGWVDPLGLAASRWTQPLPIDNRLPLYLAQAFQSGHVHVGQPSAVMGDWLYSDRPPLQTAMFMATPGFLLRGADPLAYQSAAVSLQMLSLIAVWALVRSVTSTPWVAVCAVIVTFFSPIVLVNGLFVWPKLLAASFLLCLAAIHQSPRFDEAKSSPLAGALVGALAALAMLSHGASAFAILGIGLASLVLGRVGRWRYVAAMIVTALALYAPWVAYQKFVDPPGDRLLKWHLAGVVPIDERSFVKTLKDSYKAKTWAELRDIRQGNFAGLVAHTADVLQQTLEAAAALTGGQADKAAELGKALRISQFFGVVAGTGLLGLFYVFGLAGLIWRESRPMCVAIAATLLVWVALLFSPLSAVIHQGSYFPELALIALAVIVMAKLSRTALVAVAVIHCALTIFQYSI